MSRTAVIVAIILAAVVALAAAFTLRGEKRSAAASDAPLLAFDPLRVASLTIEHAGGARDLVRRAADAPGGAPAWELVRSPAGGAASAPWPINPANVRAALRMLADLRPVAGGAAKGAGSKLSSAPRAVSVTLEDGSITRVAFAPAALGGIVLAASASGAATPVDSAVADALFSPGPTGWRDRSALPGVGVDASRITLAWPDATVTLARVGARWSLTAPVGTRADPEMVQKILAALTSLVVRDFAGDSAAAPAPDACGFDLARLRITVETDERSPDNDRGLKTKVRRATLTIGAATPDGKGAYATPADSPGSGGLVLTLNAAPALELASEPTAYVARTASGALPADVGEIFFAAPAPMTSARYVRTLDGWAPAPQQDAPEGAQPLYGSLTSEQIDELLALLCTRRATAVTLPAPDAASDFRVFATVMLVGFNPQDLLDELVFGTSGAGALPTVRESHGPNGPGVTRVYADADVRSLAR